jgi:hypothetical protein
MRLPNLTKTQKKAAIGGGAAVGLLTLTWLALRGSKSSAPSLPPPPASDPHWVTKGQRVIAWPTSSVLSYGPGKGQLYIKFKASDGHIRGGFVDENKVQRDPPPDTPQSPMSSIQVAQSRALAGIGALSGLGAGANLPQQQVPAAPPAVLNAVMTDDSVMFATADGKTQFKTLTDQLIHLLDIITNGNVVFADEDTFRKIYMHGGTRVLDLVPSIFYKDGKFTLDNLATHSWCQTYAAQVVQLGNDWLWPFYNQSVYRYPANVTPDADLDRYPNSPIDPVKDNAAFEAALNAAIESSVQAAMKKASLGSLLDGIKALIGEGLMGATFSQLGGKLANLGYMIEVTPDLQGRLIQFASDMAAQNKTSLDTLIPPVVDGKTIPDDMLARLRASAGVMLIGGGDHSVINMFETDNTDKDKGVVNPCIKPLDFGTVVSMIAVVVGFFLTIVSLGSAGAFGVAIQAISFVYNVQDSIQKLSNLSK